jgi:Zn-dependent peptidase ImmA (M78 family)/DNA-binding XRE family transcriptional regulator
MTAFNPQRLVVARRRRGHTMTSLAKLIGVQPRSISAFENGEFPPSEETLIAIVKRLRFPLDFFFGPDVEIPNTRSASFRALTKMKASARDSALGAGSVALLIAEWARSEYQLPESAILDLRGEDPETAAETVRSDWMLGYRSISNMIHLLESKGIRVFSLPNDIAETDDHGIDAYSFWLGETPFIFLNTNVTAERMRFDCAHELGHLVLHKHGGPVGQEAEIQANAFGSAFLMPASSVFAALKRPITLGGLIRLKAKWKVSVLALAYRLWKLKALSDWQYRSMVIEIKGRFKKTEPEPIPSETSQLWQKVFSNMQTTNHSKMLLAQQLSIPQADLHALTFGMNIADGGSEANTSARSRANLTVVE